MKKGWAGVLAGLVALLIGCWTVPAAQAYPQPATPTFHISVNHQVMDGGVPFIGYAKSNVKCQDWTLRFLSQSASGAGKKFQHKFSTPKVKKKTVYPMHATCRYTVSDPDSNAKAAVRVWKGEIPITLLPRNGHGGTPGTANGAPPAGGGILPNTGGPAFWVLIAGLALLLGGGSAMVASRRRRAVGSH